MMKIALIGATGYVGSVILGEALARGHHVTAIVRQLGKLTAHKNLIERQVNIFDHDELAPLLIGHDVLISSYNAFGGVSLEKGHENQILGAHAMIKAVKEASVPRLLVVGGAGSLDVAPNVRLVDTDEFPAEWKEMALAMAEVLSLLRKQQDLDWTFLSPSAMLEPGKRTNIFRLGGDTLLRDASGESRISTQDYAVAMLDEVESAAHSRLRFTVGY
jgi:putative NADH-flavin reductase